MPTLERPSYSSSQHRVHLDVINQDVALSRTVSTRIHNESILRDLSRKKRRQLVARYAPFAIIPTATALLAILAT